MCRVHLEGIGLDTEIRYTRVSHVASHNQREADGEENIDGKKTSND